MGSRNLDLGSLAYPHEDEFFAEHTAGEGWPEARGYHPRQLPDSELRERLEWERRHDSEVELAHLNTPADSNVETDCLCGGQLTRRS